MDGRAWDGAVLQVVAELFYFFQLEFDFQNTSLILSCVTISVAASISDPVTSWPVSVSSAVSPSAALCTALFRLEAGIRPIRASVPPVSWGMVAVSGTQGRNLAVWEVLGHKSSRDAHESQGQSGREDPGEDFRQAGGGRGAVPHPLSRPGPGGSGGQAVHA